MSIGMIFVNIAVGSVIGGVTNELAIRMLFRPYNPWMIGSFRVPFTPGLIPRRRDEIGVQMGRLVEEHLLTAEGVSRAIESGKLDAALANWLVDRVEGWLEREQTSREMLARFLPTSFAPDGSLDESLRASLYEKWQTLTSRMLAQVGENQLGDLISSSGKAKLDEYLDATIKRLLTQFADHLQSPAGHGQVAALLRGVLSRGGGGMLGGLVGMFLNEDKLVGMMLPYMDELLRKPELAERVAAVIHKEVDRFLQKPIKEVLALIGQEQIDAWNSTLFAKVEQEVLKYADKPIAELIGPFRQTIVENWIPQLAVWSIALLKKNVEPLFHKLPIREIVARQVEGFPLERVEEMVVGISGKEFRMITVLGFILGGIIGLVQGLLNFLL